MVPSIMASRHTTTTMFDCWYDVLFMKCCVGFMPDVTGHTPSKKFNFCLISPHNICPKVMGIIKIFFGKCETSLCILFGQQWLWNSPWIPFLPSLFLIVESWTLTLSDLSVSPAPLSYCCSLGQTNGAAHCLTMTAVGVKTLSQDVFEQFWTQKDCKEWIYFLIKLILRPKLRNSRKDRCHAIKP